MKSLDLKKKIIRPESSQHSQHQAYLRAEQAKLERYRWRKAAWSAAFVLMGAVFLGQAVFENEQIYFGWVYEYRSEVQKLRTQSLARYNPLPVEEPDPKFDLLVQYLREKKSPLATYAGLLSRLPHWKLLLGIAHAESNLCKKTNRNNCWGIGPGTPFAYDDIAESLYYANYLLEKFGAMGMRKPETLVRTYVGYEHPGWVTAVRDVFYELEERGIQ